MIKSGFLLLNENQKKYYLRKFRLKYLQYNSLQHYRIFTSFQIFIFWFWLFYRQSRTFHISRSYALLVEKNLRRPFVISVACAQHCAFCNESRKPQNVYLIFISTFTAKLIQVCDLLKTRFQNWKLWVEQNIFQYYSSKFFF